MIEDQGVELSQLIDGYSLEATSREMQALSEARLLIPVGTSISIADLSNERFGDRVETARLVESYGFKAMPHFAARRISSRDALRRSLAELQHAAAVSRAFIIAGDVSEPLGPFPDALALIETGWLGEHGIQTVGISGYPEPHPHIDNIMLWRALLDKYRALQALEHDIEIITQFGFDADPMLSWLEELRARGVTAPVKLGIPGPSSVRTLLRYAAVCGVGASAKVMAKYGLSITNLLSSAGPNRMLERLARSIDPARHGRTVIHFYPFGGLSRTAIFANAFRDTART